MVNVPAEIAIRQLRELDPSTRLVIVHPGYVQQHLLLSALVSEPGAMYVCFDGNSLSEGHLNSQFNAALTSQALDGSPDEISTVVLDEVDRANTKALHSFLLKLMNRIGSARVVVVSRHVPQGILSDRHWRKQATYVPVDESLMLWDYAQQSDNNLLEVRALGAGRILLNGQSVDHWDGVLPRSLFFYLVDRGMTTRSEIFETFWPTLSTREATNVFHVTKRKISEVLGMDLTVYWSGFYRISPEIRLSYDAAVFSEMIQDSAIASISDARRLLERAISLYRCDFLTSVEMEWVNKRRKELLESYGEALISLAKIEERAGEAPHALGLYLRASITNRQREDLARSIMTLYRELGKPQDALLIYQRLEGELERSLGVSPAPQLQDLAAEVRAEMQAVTVN